MENHQKTSFTFEIENFSERKYLIWSPIFISGQCHWFVKVYPIKDNNYDHVSVYLHVANPQSLRPGWKRRAHFSLILSNQSGKEVKIPSDSCDLFCTELSSSYPKILPPIKLKEEGFLENDKLIITVEVKVVEVVHPGELTGKEMVEFKELQDLYNGVQQNKEVVKNCELMNMDMKQDSLKSNHHEVSLKDKKRDDADESRFQKLEERLKNLELMELDCLKSKLEQVSIKNKKADADRSRVQRLEERLKNLELMGLDCLKSKLELVSIKNKKADADRSRIQRLEERVKKLELMELDDLKSKLEEVSLERKKSDDAYRSRVYQLEECFKNLELMVLDFKVELDKKKDKSCDDGFLLVDEFA